MTANDSTSARTRLAHRLEAAGLAVIIVAILGFIYVG